MQTAYSHCCDVNRLELSQRPITARKTGCQRVTSPQCNFILFCAVAEEKEEKEEKRRNEKREERREGERKAGAAQFSTAAATDARTSLRNVCVLSRETKIHLYASRVYPSRTIPMHKILILAKNLFALCCSYIA